MEFKKYHCQNGVATPVNPYYKLHQIECGVGKWETLPEWQHFETFAQSNTVSCPEDLIGEYRVEDCEIVWQSRLKGTIEWFEVFPEAYEKSNNHFTNYREYCDSMGAFARLYLRLKPVVKEEPPIVVPKGYWYCSECDMEVSSNNVTDDNCHKACGNSVDMCLVEDHPTMAEPEVKQQFGEWISVETELPKESGLVEICLADTQDIYIAFYKKSRKLFQVWGAGRDPIIDMKTTHWKPMPKPPMYKCREIDCDNNAVKEEYPGNAYFVCANCYEKLHPSPPKSI